MNITPQIISIRVTLMQTNLLLLDIESFQCRYWHGSNLIWMVQP